MSASLLHVAPSTAIWLAMLVPVIAALLISLLSRRPNLREAVTLLAAAAVLWLVVGLVPVVLGGVRPGIELFQVLPGLSIKFVLEPLGMVFALVASSLWLVSTLYSIGYMRGNREARQTRFYVFFALAIASALGIAFAGNFFTLFVFYEILTLITFPLVTHHGTRKARSGGRVYLGVLLSSSIVLLLPALIWVWSLAGSTDFVSGGLLNGKIEGPAVLGLLALCAFGVGKAALMPIHRWLPAAMVAPTPVSALLHAVAVVKAGVFTVVKLVVYVFGLDLLRDSGAGELLLWVAAFTLVSASVVATRADNLKRRLAYSTISQLAYVVLATALLAPISIIGAVMHLVAHAFGKITLFFAAGAIYTAAHKTEVSELDGIGRRMPITMTAFAIGSLSMIGLPPAAGLVSKWFILQGAMATQSWIAVGALVASTLLGAAYLLPIVYRAFFRAPADAHAHGEAPTTMVVAMVLTAGATVAIFLMPDLALRLAELVVRR